MVNGELWNRLKAGKTSVEPLEPGTLCPLLADDLNMTKRCGSTAAPEVPTVGQSDTRLFPQR